MIPFTYSAIVHQFHLENRSARSLAETRFQQKILHKGKAFTAFGAASGEDFASAFGCHSCSETATAGSDEFGGLISSFHGSLPFPSAFSTEACYCLIPIWNYKN